MKAWMLAAAGLLWLHAGLPAFAAELAKAVPGHPGLTHRDLLHHIIPDLAPDGSTGHVPGSFRHIEGSKEQTIPPENLSLGFVETLAIPGDATRIVLFADLGQAQDSVATVAVLALFALAPKVRLLDIVEVGNDRFTAPRHKMPLLAPGVPLIVIDSTHHNSSQSYQSTELIFLHGDRFNLIDSVFTFGEANCRTRSTQEAAIATSRAPGPYRAVRVVVRETVTSTGEDCGEAKALRLGVTFHRATYRWDTRRRQFVTRSRELTGLAACNAKRF